MRRHPTHTRFVAALVAAALVACAPSRAAAQAEVDDAREQFAHGDEELGRFNKTWSLPSDTTKAEAAALNARWKALGEELKTTPSEFAGTYFKGGETRQSYLRWAPGGGFVYLYVYERFAVLNFSYGAAEVTPAAVVFRVEREQRGDEGRPPQVTPSRWVAARWKLANYLVAESEAADFGMYVGGFGRFNDFNGPCCEFAPFFSDTPRRAPQVSFDVPSVPAPYARLMRRPVEATIRFVGRKRVVKDYGLGGELYGQWFQRASLTPVTIDAGRGRGLKPGLLLRLVGEPGGQYLKVTRVGATRSDGVVVRHVHDEGEVYYDLDAGEKEPQRKPFPPVRVGTRVTSAPLVY